MFFFYVTSGSSFSPPWRIVTFAGSDVWKYEAGTSQIAAGFPKSISSVFAGLPNDVDAALHYPNNKTYIFKVPANRISARQGVVQSDYQQRGTENTGNLLVVLFPSVY